MWARDLVARLSPKGSQVLLALLLSRSASVEYSTAEFARLTGLGQRSIAPALLELTTLGLVQIIAQPGKPSVVRLVHPEDAYETTVVETSPDRLEAVEKPALLAGGTADNADVADSNSGKEGVGVKALLDACQMADESQDKELRVAALQDVWDYAFPYADYPLQRLTNDAAKRLLVNRSVVWVAGVVLDAVGNAKSKIGSPRAYIERAVANQEARDNKGAGVAEGVGINDELRNLARLGREQFHEKDQNSGGHQ